MIVVTGGSGFLGTNLCEAARAAGIPGHTVRVLDRRNGDDLFDPEIIPSFLDGADTVVHLAANADVRAGWDHPGLDMEQVLATQNLLNGMREAEVKRLIFASTGSVYHPHSHAHHESCPVHATSLYAASKIAAEQLIAAWANAGHVNATVLRFVSILGPHYSHGHVIDFVKKLQADPHHIELMGTGNQRKAYIHVSDVVRAILLLLEREEGQRNFGTFNVGTENYANPVTCARWVAEAMGIESQLRITTTGESWPGDNPDIRLDTFRLEQLGWHTNWSLEESIKGTVKWLLTQG